MATATTARTHPRHGASPVTAAAAAADPADLHADAAAAAAAVAATSSFPPPPTYDSSNYTYQQRRGSAQHHAFHGPGSGHRNDGGRAGQQTRAYTFEPHPAQSRGLANRRSSEPGNNNNNIINSSNGNGNKPEDEPYRHQASSTGPSYHTRSVSNGHAHSHAHRTSSSDALAFMSHADVAYDRDAPPPLRDGGPDDRDDDGLKDQLASLQPPRSPPPVPTALQPRVAVVLNVPRQWHPWLFSLRLCSILPASWWGLPSLLRLLLHFLPGPPDQFLLVRPETLAFPPHGLTTTPCNGGACAPELDATAIGLVVAPYALTDTFLATIWCFACGYLSFFFTDCLMSRWLIHYTPQATIVRLLSINAVNAYVTLTVLSLSGGFEDPRLLLPGWVGIATTLTVCYHITHQKINIRKETSTSINVFSIASYITMIVLLAHMQTYQPGYPTMPAVAKARHLWEHVVCFFTALTDLVKEKAEL